MHKISMLHKQLREDLKVLVTHAKLDMWTPNTSTYIQNGKYNTREAAKAYRGIMYINKLLDR